ncbi:MAG: thiamine pyrophosphate-dependent enzyme [Planctomycetota bacterium]|jgi:2-oxoglutarate ferredoxin oxidoreductase subunit beta
MAIRGAKIDINQFLRKSNLPHIWCAGCGNGIILNSMLRVIGSLGYAKDDVAMVSGIGCSSRMPGYVDFNTLHTTHGRALPFATGVKLGRPDMRVIAVMGDGDSVAIGGNHFIHAARRNIGISAVVVNNYIYGMTGGQVSPTTGGWEKASTAPLGNPEAPFDICRLAKAAGAVFAARTTVYHVREMGEFLAESFETEGFSVVEVISPCPTCYGKWNPPRTGAEMVKKLKAQADAMKLGVFAREERAEMSAQVRELQSRAGWTGGGGKP